MQSKLGVILGVIAVVLVIVGIIGPWWTVQAQANLSVGPVSMSLNAHNEFGLFGAAAFFQMGATSSSNTTNYNDAPHVGAVFLLATILLVLGLICGIGLVVVGAMSGSRPSFQRLGGLLGVLSFVILLIGTLYVMSALPDAVNQDSGAPSYGTAFSGFWGTKTSAFGSFGQASVVWSAGWGWYIALVAAIVFLVAGVVLFVARRPAMASPLQAPPPTP